MRRGRLFAGGLVVAFALLLAFGGRIAAALEHWLLALHGRH